MPDETKLERMKRLAGNLKNIRNIATSAHIHHGKCVAPDTRLLLADGSWMAAESLFEAAEKQGTIARKNEQEIVYDISQIRKKLEIFSLNKETGRIRKKALSHAWKLRGGSAIKVSLRNGASIKTTPEHKYFVLEDLEFAEKEASELKLGDRIVCARSIAPESQMDIKEEILKKLACGRWFARINESLGNRLKEEILRCGLENISKSLGLQIKTKSFYHGIWQHRYCVEHLLAVCSELSIPATEAYDAIDAVSFRAHAKSTSQISLPKNEKELEELFYLAGLFFGDGSGCRFIAGKPFLAGRCISICNSLGFKAQYIDRGNRTPEVVANAALKLLLCSLFGYPLRRKSHEIKVNDFIAKSPDTFVASFVRGYFDCDGTVEESRRAVSITSASSHMLKDLQLLLLRFGCIGIVQKDTLYLSGISARNFAAKIRFGLNEKQDKTNALIKRSQGSIVADTVPIAGPALTRLRKVPMASIDHHYYKYESAQLTPTMDTLLVLKQKLAQKSVPTNQLDRLTTGHLAFIEVTAIESVYEPIVYDFSVPDFRNFVAEGIVIHNTALTDNLLAASGFMSEAAAGDLDKGMMTWQHLDEQTRLLTVDAANVSMVHEYNNEEFLINLIDTPGHIDFGGNVTRAMRAIDGTIVLVCASEGIMPQTETVLKQALRERVKPVLFINKVDRLIKEMLFTPEQIQQRLVKIVIEFNRLIEEIAEPEFKQKWQVSFENGSVAFGSARENWALSVHFMQKTGITFKEVVRIYNELNEEEMQKFVWEKMPVHEVILDMVVKHLPNPVEAQAYRIPKIWHGDLESEFGKNLVSANPKGKLAFVVTRVVIEPKSGREICAGRLFSGTMQEGMTVYLNNAKQEKRVAQVFIYQGIKPEMLSELPAGNVIAISGVEASVGETITEEPEQPFEEIRHIFEPVITKAIEAAKPSDLPKLIEVMRKVVKEDPSIKVDINEETGEHLMHGMGELHLEIVEDRIKTEKKMEIKTSEPIVVYKETITRKGQEIEGKSPNKHNKLYFVVEPLDNETYETIKRGDLPEMRIKKKDLTIRDTFVRCGMESKEALKVKEIFRGNILVDQTRGIVHIGEVMDMIMDMFEDVMSAGPIAKEPCVKLRVNIMDCKLHEDSIHRGPAQVYPAVRDGIRGSMMTANPMLLEPFQILLIEAPNDYMGELSKIVNNKRGQLLEMNQEGARVVVKAKLPVGELFGWSNALRSATGGRGNSSLIDQMFEKMPAELQEKTIKQIRQRKGLTEGQLGA